MSGIEGGENYSILCSLGWGGGGGSTLHMRKKDREETVSPRYNAVEP